jgi:glycosyltransferase involved in cell wall biosynthesis
LRIKYPLSKIRDFQLADVDLIYRADHETENTVRNSDVIVLGRAAGEVTLGAIKRAKMMGKKVVFDLDDNMFDVSVISPHYKRLGIMPVNVETSPGTFMDLYKDGEDGFDVKANRSIRKSFLNIIRTVDCITTTTTPLEKVYRRYHDRVRVIPNAIDFRLWDKPDISHDGDEVRIMYTGAANHREDWMFVYPVLNDLLEKYPKVKVVLMGTDWRDCTRSLDYSRVEVHPWVDFEAYPHLVKSLCCHIGLAPISKTDFNDCRSELKWVEYSSQKMATVASPWGPYKRSMKDGVTGLLADEPKDWFQALSTLIEDSTLRERIGTQAYKECRKKFNLDFTVDKWVGVFQEVLT